ncbi:helix-turn-helix domain-containing protein [Bacteroidota bacterium]
MSNPLNIILIILFIGAGQGFLFSIVLFTVRKGNRVANRFLATMIFLFSFVIFSHSMGEVESSPIDKTSHDHIIVQLIFFLFGPLLYFYIKTLTQPAYKLRRSNSLHLLPLILSLIVFVPLRGFTFGITGNPNNIFIASMFVITIHFIIYIILSVIILLRHSKKIKDTFSSTEKINLNWLKFLIIGLLLIFPFGTIAEIIGGGSALWNLIWLMVSVFIYTMGFMSLRQPEIYLGSDFIVSEDEKKRERKYQKSALTSEKIVEYFERLENYINKNKPYLKSNLTLRALAGMLSLSTHHLSQVINEKTGNNFFDYINSYRVEEAKLLLEDQSKNNLTITSIGFEAGFNSVSSFNSVFKKFMKTTPSQYRKLAG